MRRLWRLLLGAEAAYVAAGGSVSDLVYSNVEDALAAQPQVTQDIVTATSALSSATQALVAAAAQAASLALAAAVSAAAPDLAAYLVSGGTDSDATYTAVTLATSLDGLSTALANLRATTSTNMHAFQTARQDAYTALSDFENVVADVFASSVYADLFGLSNVNPSAPNGGALGASALTALLVPATAALRSQISSVSDALTAETSYIAAGGSSSDVVYIDLANAVASNPINVQSIADGTVALNSATQALLDAAAQLLADAKAAAGADLAAYLSAGGSETDGVYAAIAASTTVQQVDTAILALHVDTYYLALPLAVQAQSLYLTDVPYNVQNYTLDSAYTEVTQAANNGEQSGTVLVEKSVALLRTVYAAWIANFENDQASDLTSADYLSSLQLNSQGNLAEMAAHAPQIFESFKNSWINGRLVWDPANSIDWPQYYTDFGGSTSDTVYSDYVAAANANPVDYLQFAQAYVALENAVVALLP